MRLRRNPPSVMASKKKSPSQSASASKTGAPVGQLLVVGFEGTEMSAPLAAYISPPA
jgi:hypothetical protein